MHDQLWFKLARPQEVGVSREVRTEWNSLCVGLVNAKNVPTTWLYFRPQKRPVIQLLDFEVAEWRLVGRPVVFGS